MADVEALRVEDHDLGARPYMALRSHQWCPCPSRDHGRRCQIESPRGNVGKVSINLLLRRESRINKAISNLLDRRSLQFVAGWSAHGEVGVGLSIYKPSLFRIVAEVFGRMRDQRLALP